MGETVETVSCFWTVVFAPAYLFLAANSESSFITGEVIHVNGGQAMPG